jgi:hypothetical protein
MPSIEDSEEQQAASLGRFWGGGKIAPAQEVPVSHMDFSINHYKVYFRFSSPLDLPEAF